jgi:hypothetical protein
MPFMVDQTSCKLLLIELDEIMWVYLDVRA